MPNKKYKVLPANSFLKDLKKIDPRIAELALKKIDKLEINPYCGKKLINKKLGQWRIKITKDYRVRYDIKGNEIILIMAKHRKDVYKR